MNWTGRLKAGVDIGGTKINLGLVDDVGHVLISAQMPTLTSETPQHNAYAIADRLRELTAEAGVSSDDIGFLGVGVPGTADVASGIVEYCPNLGWTDEPLGTFMQDITGLPVRVMQDSRNSAWAEWLFGAGQGRGSLLAVTVGTGIGCGIILDGKILMGDMNTAGELGHSLLHREGRPCSCGNAGCVERYASGTGILERALDEIPETLAGLPPTTETVFMLAGQGEPTALRLIHDCVDDLAHAVTNAINLLSIPSVIISGGLCVYDELFVAPLARRIHDFAYFPWKRKNLLQVVPSTMGSDAPMVGAASLDRAFGADPLPAHPHLEQNPLDA